MSPPLLFSVFRIPSSVFCLSPAWWLRRGDKTRSHPELGRQTPQRQWYFVSRHGRVGRRQARERQIRIRKTEYGIRTPPAFGVRVHRLQTASSFTQSGKHAGRGCRPYSVFRPLYSDTAGWSSPVARQAHNLKAAGSNPAPATKFKPPSNPLGGFLFALSPSRSSSAIAKLPTPSVKPALSPRWRSAQSSRPLRRRFDAECARASAPFQRRRGRQATTDR